MARLVYIAGVNGAGKSTLYNSLRDVQNIQRVNVDEIIKNCGSWRNTSDVVKAGKIAVRKIQKYFNQNVSFHQETTLCGKSVLYNIKIAKAKGYFIEFHYIGLDSVDIAKERVHKRVLQGGHGIPDEDIKRRYNESFVNMKNILDTCDLAIFYDNTVKFRRIAIYKNGKTIRQSSILPEWYIKYFL